MKGNFDDSSSNLQWFYRGEYLNLSLIMKHNLKEDNDLPKMPQLVITGVGLILGWV